jgi:hypothetical protein
VGESEVVVTLALRLQKLGMDLDFKVALKNLDLAASRHVPSLRDRRGWELWHSINYLH